MELELSSKLPSVMASSQNVLGGALQASGEGKASTVSACYKSREQYHACVMKAIGGTNCRHIGSESIPSTVNQSNGKAPALEAP